MFDFSRLINGLVKQAPRLAGLKKAKQDNTEEDVEDALTAEMAADAEYDKLVDGSEGPESAKDIGDHFSRNPVDVSWVLEQDKRGIPVKDRTRMRMQ